MAEITNAVPTRSSNALDRYVCPPANSTKSARGTIGSPSLIPAFSTSSLLHAPISIYMSFRLTTFSRSSGDSKCGGFAPMTPTTSPIFD